MPNLDNDKCPLVAYCGLALVGLLMWFVLWTLVDAFGSARVIW